MRKRAHLNVGTKKRISQKYNIDEDSIAIARLIKGSILVEWVTARKNDAFKLFKENWKSK